MAAAAALILALGLIACRGPYDPDGDGVAGLRDCAPYDPAYSSEQLFYTDADGDGYGDPGAPELTCVPDPDQTADDRDCDDTDRAIHPGAEDAWYDGIDSDCGWDNDWDADGDGHSDVSYPVGGSDCDDADPTVHAGAEDECGDGLDTDCSGFDGSTLLVGYLDADGDGYGDSGEQVTGCALPAGYVEGQYNEQGGRLFDCDDDDPDVHPGAEEIWYDGVDQDCSSAGAPEVSDWDADGDGYDGPGGPRDGEPGSLDCDDSDAGAYPGASDGCGDGIDQDCDGADGEDQSIWYLDADGDGAGDVEGATSACEAPDGHVAEGGDCDDADDGVHPGAREVWYDGIDQDCDGDSDWDADGDGYDIGDSWGGGDCDDDDDGVNPDANEYCEPADRDCDGSATAGALDAGVWYADADADGWGAAALAMTACARPAGYAAVAGDCDDSDAAVHPAAAEDCADGVDTDCDGELGVAWYPDADGDGFGAAAAAVESCSQPSGAVADDSDCDDGDGDVHPGAEEICGDGLDNDCSGGAPSCGLAGARDLSDADRYLYGESSGDYAGTAAAGVGDLDGDGYDDLLVGAPRAGGSSGAAYLVLGPLSGDLELGAADAIVRGDAGVSVAMGSAVAAGPGGVWIGGESDNTGGTLAGAVWGYPDLVGAGLSGGERAAADAGAVRYGEAAYEYAGEILSVGDVDGDGEDDLAVGVPRNDRGGASAGAAFVAYGPLTGTGSLGDAEAALLGEAASEYAGYTLDLGDVDGDGCADALVGAPYSDRAATSAGAAYLLFGPFSGSIDLGASDLAIDGRAAGDQLGAVALAGDTDGDGYPELLVGAQAAGDDDAGAAWLIDGAGASAGEGDLDGAIASVSGDAATDGAGYLVAGAGDADGDGLADAAIYAWGVDAGGTNAGAAYLFLGPISGALSAGDAHAVVSGDESVGQSDKALGGAGDIDGDGYDDLLLSVYDASPLGRALAGQIGLYSGGPGL